MQQIKIAAIEVTAWDVPMRAPYRSAQRTTTTAHNVLVTVTLSGGSVGYGESAPATYVTGETQESVVTAARTLAGVLVGETVEAGLATLTAHRETPGARGALEMALWDAAARAENLPLFRYLGATENAPLAYATDLSLPILPVEEIAARASQAAQNGFRALKIKIGSGNPAEDIARVRAVAAAAPNATLRLDGNQGFTAEQAVEFIGGIAELLPRLELFEQPTPAEDEAGMAFVQHRLPLPVFADESVHHAEDARRLIESGICRGVVLKLAKSGLSETRHMAETAHKAGGSVLFGCMMETHIAIGAALHLAAALGGDIVSRLDLDGHLLVNDSALLIGGFTQERDVLYLADEPGLGIKV